MIDPLEAQRLISQHRPENAVVLEAMTACREFPQVTTNANLDLPLLGCMGKASSIALGLALARPDLKVIVLDADGSLLMNLGSLVTIANQAPSNLIHFVLENGVYRTTGGQPIPGAGTVSFADLAKAAGYPNVYTFSELSELSSKIEAVLNEAGPTLACLKLPAETKRPPFASTNTAASLARFRAGLESTLAKVRTNR